MLRSTIVPAIASLLVAAPCLAEVPTEHVQALRAFSGQVDESTIDAWTASLGRVDYMPYDAIKVEAVSDDGATIAVTLSKGGAPVRLATLQLDASVQDEASSEPLLYTLEQGNMYDHFKLRIEASFDAAMAPLKVAYMEVEAERTYAMAPLYDSRGKATYREDSDVERSK